MISLNIVGIDYSSPYEHFSFLGALILLLALGFIFILSWFLRKGPISFRISENQDLDNYILNFDSKDKQSGNETSFRKHSIITKFILLLLAAIFFVEPIYRIILTLRFPYFY